MTYLAAERMKLLSTRSPWWCAGITIVIFLFPIGLRAILAEGPLPNPLSSFLGVAAATAVVAVAMVLLIGALSATTEYRFSTIRATFLAVPNRTVALVAKSAVLAVAGAVLGAVGTLLAWGLTAVTNPGADLMFTTAAHWRAVVAIPLVFAITAVLAVAVGTLVRQSAAAIVILLVWVLLIESLVPLIPNVGAAVFDWLPFASAARGMSVTPGLWDAVRLPLGPWGSLGYFAAIALAFLAFAVVVVRRRDA